MSKEAPTLSLQQAINVMVDCHVPTSFEQLRQLELFYLATAPTNPKLADSLIHLATAFESSLRSYATALSKKIGQEQLSHVQTKALQHHMCRPLENCENMTTSPVDQLAGTPVFPYMTTVRNFVMDAAFTPSLINFHTLGWQNDNQQTQTRGKRYAARNRAAHQSARRLTCVKQCVFLAVVGPVVYVWHFCQLIPRHVGGKPIATTTRQ